MVSMKQYIFAFITLFVTLPGIAQIPDIREGAYRNSMDFEKGILLLRAEFRFKQIELDTTFYRVSTKDKNAKSPLKKHVIWGIYQDSVLYLDARRLGMKKHYVKVQEIGKYCYLIGRPIMDNAQKDVVARAGVFGLAGVGVTAAFVTSSISGQIHYLVDLKTGVPHLLTQPYLEHILATPENLLAQYKMEKNPGYLSVMLKYARLLNNISGK